MTAFVADSVWEQLKKIARDSQRPADVAVAYFGQGAATLLPLPKGSRLVVDASEQAVKSGQTHPDDLASLVRRGVRVYSVLNLHAKVFVFGGTAFVGSANVSRRSASMLVEAAIMTTEREVVKTARKFVQDLCLNRLGPEELDRLQGLYRPPKIIGNRSTQRRKKTQKVKPELPRVLLAQLELKEPPEGSESAEEAGRNAARKQLEQPRKHALEDFWWPSPCPYKLGDIVVQVLNEGNNRRMVSSPGKVVYMRKWRGSRRGCTFVYVELPRRKRVALDRLARRMGRGAKEKLSRGGRVSAEFSEELLKTFKE